MAELRNIRWKKFIGALLDKDALVPFLKSRSLQWWLTIAFRKNGYILLDDLEDLVLEYKGVRFLPEALNYPRVFEAWDRYRISSIREDDVVLDIGANIGSYTFPANSIAKATIAVEPIFGKELLLNIGKNTVGIGLEVILVALGDREGGWAIVDCGSYSRRAPTTRFYTLINKYQPTVLRLDCGGEEWSINLSHLEGIRLLEVEFHYYTKEQREAAGWKKWKKWLEDNDFGYIARWSKHRHWLYLSAEKGWERREEVQLRDGSFRGRSLELWKGQ